MVLVGARVIWVSNIVVGKDERKGYVDSRARDPSHDGRGVIDLMVHTGRNVIVGLGLSATEGKIVQSGQRITGVTGKGIVIQDGG